jgi:hypothetical protein
VNVDTDAFEVTESLIGGLAVLGVVEGDEFGFAVAQVTD